MYVYAGICVCLHEGMFLHKGDSVSQAGHFLINLHTAEEYLEALRTP